MYHDRTAWRCAFFCGQKIWMQQRISTKKCCPYGQHFFVDIPLTWLPLPLPRPPLLIGPDHHSNLSSSRINTGKTSHSSLTLHHLLKMEPTQCSETSAFNTQTPGKYPEDNSSFLTLSIYNVTSPTQLILPHAITLLPVSTLHYVFVYVLAV
jgi:hypothetical protein